MKKESQLIQFIEQFNSPKACYELLSMYKWKNGFKCRRCNCTESMKGRTDYHRRCKACYYDESCTAHTLFHKIKFPINKAFAIVFQMATMKKGMSSCEISRQYGITQETAWFFAKKVRLAMYAEFMAYTKQLFNSEQQRRTSKRGLKRALKVRNLPKNDDRLRLNKDRFYGVEFALKSSLKKPMKGTKRYQNMMKRISDIDILRPQKRGNRCLHEINLLHPKLEAFWPEFRKYNLKTWIIGIHHRLTLEHLQGYLSEFAFRYLNGQRIFSLPAELIRRFTEIYWRPYSTLIAS
jgi:hypothetical protein